MTNVRKVLELFGPEDRWRLTGLFVLVLAMALVQTVGVASILPFMSIVAEPESLHETEWLARVYEALGFQTIRGFLIFAGLAVLVIMTFSNAFSAFTSWMLLRFVWNRQYRLSVRLLAKYLRQPYAFYLDRNSAGLAKNILAEVKEAINGFVLPAMRAVAQILVAVCIVALLVWVEPLLALIVVIVLGGAYGGLYAVVRRKQMLLGQERLAANEARFKAAGEAFGGIKEMKILGREGELLERFSRPARVFSKVLTSNAVISEVPRYVLETVAFGGILLIVIYMLGSQEDFGEAVAVLSLYALAGYRLMPALQQVFAGFAKARFYSAALDDLHAELASADPAWHPPPPESPRLYLWWTRTPPPTPPEEPGIPFDREIHLDRISFTYPDNPRPTLHEVDLTIPKNSTVGFAGSTGSGKTTLVDILLGLLEPGAGAVRIDGTPLGPADQARWRRHLGYIPQHIYLLDDTVARNIAFGLGDDRLDPLAVERAARIAHLHEFVGTLPRGYDTVVGERGVRLSGGQRQRIGIARALYHDPDVLVMDEATSALDGITEDAVMQAIRELASRKTIIVVAHRLATLGDCDTIHLFEHGRVSASGTYAELLERNSQFRAMAKGRSHTPSAV